MFDVDFHILNQKATPAIYADTLALRPAASFAGRLFVDTASPYGIYRDTGTAWVQIAAGGSGVTSTGVNGLNGTTNIGLGGTLANNTTILGANFTFTFDVFSQINLKTNNITGSAQFLGIGNELYLNCTNNSAFTTQLRVTNLIINTNFGNASYGISLNDLTGKFVIGDYSNGRKYNSFVVDDDNDRFYITTSYNQANTDQDLFYVSNNPNTNERFVKLGDFNSYTNDTYLIIDDFANTLITSGINGIAGLNFDFSTENYELGANNAKIICDNTNSQIDINAPNIVLSSTPGITSGTITNTATATIPNNYLSIQINGNNYKIELLNP